MQSCALVTRTSVGLMSKESMISEPWVSVEGVARHLGVAKDSVYRWIQARGMPAHKIGRLWKFKLSEVDEWVRAGGTDRHDEGENGRSIG